MKRLSVAVILMVIAVLLLSPSAFAAGKISSLEIQVWPQYDKQEILLMYAGSSTGTNNITLWFPSGTQPASFLKIDSSSKKTPVDVTQKESGGLLGVSMPTPEPSWFGEGYWNGYKGSGDTKQFSFKFKVPADTDAIQVYIQQPVNSSNFKVTPKPDSVEKGFENFKYARYAFNNKKAGETLTFDVSYKKSDSKLSSSTVSGSKSGNTSSSSTSGGTMNATTVALVVLALGLFVAGGFAFYSFKNEGAGRKVKTGKKQKSKTASGAANYCPNCGNKAGGKFCANCGQQLD